jgi:hypothetical protein
MRTRLLPALLAVLAALVLGAGTAPAATSVPAGWSVTPGGSFTGSGGPVDAPLSCAGTTITGVFSTGGSALLGVINRITHHSCTMGGFLAVQSAPRLPWHMNGLSHANGVTTMDITNITAQLSGPGCGLTVAGTATASYSNATGTLAVLTQNIVVTSVDPVNSCLGLIAPGSRIALLSRSYAISPRHIITPGTWARRGGGDYGVAPRGAALVPAGPSASW